MEKVLKRLYDYLKNIKIPSGGNETKDDFHYVFIEKKISELDKTCSDLDLEVFDFDKAAEEWGRILKDGINLNISKVPSCDALKISPEMRKFDLIEMKSVKNFIGNNSPDKVNKMQDIEKKCDEYKKECKDKYRWSMQILEYLILYSDCGLNKNDKKRLRDMEKDYYILSDYGIKQNPSEVLAMNLFTLSHPSNRAKKNINNESKEVETK